MLVCVVDESAFALTVASAGLCCGWQSVVCVGCFGPELVVEFEGVNVSVVVPLVVDEAECTPPEPVASGEVDVSGDVEGLSDPGLLAQPAATAIADERNARRFMRDISVLLRKSLVSVTTVTVQFAHLPNGYSSETNVGTIGFQQSQ